MSPRPFRRPTNNRRPPRPQQGRGQQDALRGGRPGSGPAGGGEAAASAGVIALERPMTVELPAAMTVKELADLLAQTPVQVIKELIKNGIIANINQTIDFETAAVVAGDLGYEVREPAAQKQEISESGEPVPFTARTGISEDLEADLQPRPPVVTVMGHVDHGKTSLLDAIRETKVTVSEAGGITQHIGAYQAEVMYDGSLRRVTFLDTPGHEAFTTMRARGAQVTDVAVLVVAADDGVMPQPREAIDHAKAAGVPLVIAINKIDKANSNPDRVVQQLAELGVVATQYGGEVEAVPVSARTREGLDALLQTIVLTADIHVNPRANPGRPAIGAVVEAKLDKTRGAVATVLVQTGTLKPGDIVAVGAVSGRIKALFDYRGKKINSAGPSTPVQVLGLPSVPVAGDRLQVMADEKTARTVAQAHEIGARRQERPEISLDEVLSQLGAGETRELNVVVKTDVQGSIEPIVASLERLNEEGIKVKLILSGTGNITESDVMLAAASGGIIIGFNVRAEAGARRLADSQRIDIRFYTIIYELVDDIRKALSGMLGPKFADVVYGHAEVRQVFRVGRGQAAGCFVLDGTITRNHQIRVLRGGSALFVGRLAALRRFKDDVREVAAGYECGMTVDGFHSFEEKDVIESFGKEQV